MAKYYTDEKHAQVVLALLKAHGIRKVIASPGTTNMAIVASMQRDPHFEMYSSVDERSAAYMACGLAAESGEAVVLSCTGATASRNYLPGLTEAYYRKIPVLAITSTSSFTKVGHLAAQVIDRSSLPTDVVKVSLTIPIVKDEDDLWDCEIKVNKAILELTRHGGGPAHINIATTHNRSYETKELPKFQIINRITPTSEFPPLPQGKIGVFIGAQKRMSDEQVEILDRFCESNNAVVFCDHTSNYKGKYRILYALAAGQLMFDSSNAPDLLIHIGEVSGDSYTMKITRNLKQVWRVSEDGEIRDTFRKLRYVFEMTEQSFFKNYIKEDKEVRNSYWKSCMDHLNVLRTQIPEMPFSNIWVASKIADQIPEHSTIHFAILNSLRSWNFFELPNSVISSSNVGGFGIDGNSSTLIGASLVNRNRLYFCITGDLGFFYDLNVLGNRHIGNNLRIILVNNGKGTEFRQFTHIAADFGEIADEYIAAAGHFGNRSPIIVKQFVEAFGFEYLSSSTKEEFEQVYERFLNPEVTDRPMLFEVFTTSADESKALEKILNIDKNVKGEVKQLAKQVFGKKSIKTFKKVLGK